MGATELGVGGIRFLGKEDGGKAWQLPGFNCWVLQLVTPHSETCDSVCSSPELYEYCIKEGYADKNLIAKWKKQGYENLCCLRCIQTRDTNFGTNCICRVPKSKLEVVSLQFVPLLCSSCSDFSQLSDSRGGGAVLPGNFLYLCW